MDSINNNYCCKYKCFRTDGDQVDGIACIRCKHFCYCICRCKSYQEKNIIK